MVAATAVTAAIVVRAATKSSVSKKPRPQKPGLFLFGVPRHAKKMGERDSVRADFFIQGAFGENALPPDDIRPRGEWPAPTESTLRASFHGRENPGWRYYRPAIRDPRVSASFRSVGRCR